MGTTTIRHSLDLDFLRGGGEMGERIRAFPWQNTPLGSPDTWPLPLRTTVRILLTTNHPVFLFFGTQHICLYNDAYRRSLGPERHPALLGSRAREGWDEIWPWIGPQIEYVMAGKGATWHENHLVPITRNGRREDVYWTYSYSPIDLPGAPNGVGGVLVMCTETTQQVRTNERLHNAQRRWQRLFDQAPGFACVLRGPTHVFEYATPSYFQLVEREDLIGKSLGEVLPWTREQGFQAALDCAYTSGEAFRANSAPVYLPFRPGAPPRYLDFIYQPIREEDGRISGIFVLGSDVTERKQAEDALREADRKKDVFLATLAHELRNPLAPIRNGIEVLKRSGEASGAGEGVLDIMERQICHLVRLVDDLLDVSRISQGKIQLQLQHLDAREAVMRAVEACGEQLRAEGRKLRLNLPTQPLPLRADHTRLVQILVNLLSNAAKHTQAGGCISVEARREGDAVLLGVLDDGAGMLPEQSNEVFGLFTQLAPEQGGLGIGLALVRELVELHGGKVSAHSKGLGQGSQFHIRLPLDPVAAPSQPAPAQHDKGQLSGCRVLLADDNRDAVASLAMLLRMLGAEVEAVHDGEQALARFEDFAPDLVLLDIGMPRLNGFETARRLRALPGGAAVPLVALTGWGQQEDRRRSAEAGFDHHLVKPLSLPELLEVIGLLGLGGAAA